MEETKQIFHPYHLWEDHKHGFYDNISGGNKEEMITEVVSLFCDPTNTKKFMRRVIDEWKYSCEHNFTNPSMNKIAYLGQSACALYKGIPSTVTMEAWSNVPIEFQSIADKIALDNISVWELRQKN